MTNILNAIVNRVVKQVITYHRMGYYLTLDDVVDMVYDELEKQNVRLIADYDDYIKDEVLKRVGKYLLKKAN